jgi:hypothetical protein
MIGCQRPLFQNATALFYFYEFLPNIAPIRQK